jgi:threonine dehydrogenase-like Zn-dependent dehydrogenase
LTDSIAAPANCALATMVAATEILPKPCDVAVIQGAGLLGIYGCALLRNRGTRRVVVVDTELERLKLVEEFGGSPRSRLLRSKPAWDRWMPCSKLPVSRGF